MDPGQSCNLILEFQIDSLPDPDNTPLRIEQATAYNGACDNGLGGAGRGAVAVNVEPCEVELDKCVAVDTNDDGLFDDEICFGEGTKWVDVMQTATGLNGIKDVQWAIKVTNPSTAVTLDGCVVNDFDLNIDEMPLPNGPLGPEGMDTILVMDVCSAAAEGLNTAEVSCSLCEGVTQDPPAMDSDSADLECLDCSVDIQKQSACDCDFANDPDCSEATFGEDCVGWLDDDEVAIKYTLSNTGEVDLDCSMGDPNVLNPGNLIPAPGDVDGLADTNPLITPVGPLALNVDEDGVMFFVPGLVCSDALAAGEPDTGIINCQCQGTANGAPVNPDDDDLDFGDCGASDTDGANFQCETANDWTPSKTCGPCDGDGNWPVEIFVANGPGNAELSCTAADTLTRADGPPEPRNFGPVIVPPGQTATIGMFSTPADFAPDDANNVVDVTCAPTANLSKQTTKRATAPCVACTNCPVDIEKCVLVDTDDDGSFADEVCFSDDADPGLGSIDGVGVGLDGKAVEYRIKVIGPEASPGNGTAGDCTISDNRLVVPGGDVPFDLAPDEMANFTVTALECNGTTEGLNTATVTCNECDGRVLNVAETDMDSAELECLRCSVDIVKQSACDCDVAADPDCSEATFGEDCVGWLNDDEVAIKYTLSNTGEVDLDCTMGDPNVLNPGGLTPAPGDVDGLADTNSLITPVNGPVSLDVDDDGVMVFVPGLVCTDALAAGEPDTGIINCQCQGTANGDPVNPADPTLDFGDCGASDTDMADFECLTADDWTPSKTCAACLEQGGNWDVEVTVTNGPTNSELSCSAVDTLTRFDGSTVVTPLGPVTVQPGSTMAIGSFAPLADDAPNDGINDVVVTCAPTANPAKTTEKPATAPCQACPVDLGCFSHTPGYWGTHPCQTQQVLNGGVVESCGVVQTNTEAATDASAVEDNCFGGKDTQGKGPDSNHAPTSPQQIQLIRQCSSAALNIAVSEQAAGSCSGYMTAGGPILERFDACCGTFCSDGNACGEDISASGCIEDLDQFNNSDDTLVPDGFGICNLVPALDWPTTGTPAADSSICQEANGNGFVSDAGAPGFLRTLGPKSCN